MPKNQSLSTVQSLISKALLQIERGLNKAKSQCLEFKELLFSRIPGSDCVPPVSKKLNIDEVVKVRSSWLSSSSFEIG